MSQQNNTEKVRDYLHDRGRISPAEARIVFGIERLAPRINELRHEYGERINTVRATDQDGKTYTRYELFHTSRRRSSR